VYESYRRPLARGAALLAPLALIALLASPAAASPETLRRSVGNILWAPVDIVLAPVVSAKTIYTNMQDIDDTPGVRIVYTVPGFAWNCFVQFGGGIIREIAGLLELVPGLGLFFFETDMDPLYDPVERGEALVDIDTPPLAVKFGVNYTTIPY
jgi:hypothetical protein